MRGPFPGILLTVGTLVVLVSGCAALMESAVEDAFPTLSIYIQDPPPPRYETEESSRLICGVVRNKKTFDVNVVVKNKRNGFETLVHVATEDDESKEIEWCTSEQIPLEPGKNAIKARMEGFMRNHPAYIRIFRVTVKADD